MKVLVAGAQTPDWWPGGSNRVHFAPELADVSPEDVMRAAAHLSVDTLIHPQPLNGEPERVWAQLAPDTDLVCIHVAPGASTTRHSWVDPLTWGTDIGCGGRLNLLAIADGEHALERALALAERRFQQVRKAHARYEPRRRSAALPRHALLVGLGVVNLVIATFLQRAGHTVTCVDSGPDPRADEPWTAYGCSRGGGNARMFSLTEADDYHDQRLGVAPDNQLFKRPPSNHGWLVSAPDQASESWIREFERVPAWLARSFNADIFSFTQESKLLWDTWIGGDRDLFEGSGMRHGLLRLYSDARRLELAVQRHDAVGATLWVHSADAVRKRFPALHDANTDVIAGGLEVKGFTLQVHDFMAKLLARLEQGGATLHFNTTIKHVRRSRDGSVTGMEAECGQPYEADDYVMSLGIDTEHLAAGSRSSGLVHGVLGCWAEIPNVEPRLAQSLKITRTGHVAEDANVTVGAGTDGSERLIVGSGYGYTGADAGNLMSAQVEHIFLAVLDSIRAYFPAAFAAVGPETIRKSFQICVRPWTASSLGVFDIEPAANGSALWVGGHNTGGFAQSPAIAAAVVAALHGRDHNMHDFYDPDRLRRVLGDVAP